MVSSRTLGWPDDASALERGRRRLRLGIAVPESASARLVAAASVVWLVVFWGYGIARHRAFLTAQLDLGDMTQTLWNTAHGRFFEATTLSGQTMSRLGGHVDPLLAGLTPLWWLWPSPLLLISTLSIGLVSGVVPVYKLAHKHIGSERAARDFAVVYLLCPLTQWNAVWDFHAVSLAIPLVLYAIWFLDENRLVPFAIFGLLAAASKEEIPLAVGLLGVWYAWSHGRRAVGAAILGAGLTITLVDFLVVIPHYSLIGQTPFANRYAGIGGSPTGILHTAVAHPGRLAGAIFSSQNLVYLALLAVVFGGLFVGAPLLALGAMPDLAINVLSNSANQHSLQFQYTAGIAPFLLAASIVGAARWRVRVPSAPAIALAFALFVCVFLGPLRFLPPVIRGALPGNPDRLAAAHAVALVPGGVPVSASNELAGHLAARRFIYTFPHVGGARWVVLDRADPTYVRPIHFAREVRRIRHLRGWTVVYAERSFLVLKKK